MIRDNYQIMTDKELSELIGTHSEKSVKTKRQDIGCAKDQAHRKYDYQTVVDEFAKTDYILLSGPEDYINAAENTLRYKCPRHLEAGVLTISLGHLQMGRGCMLCGHERTVASETLPDKEIIDRCKLLCDEKGLIYSGFNRNNGKINVEFICPDHEEVGVQTMQYWNMKRDYIKGCPHCINKKDGIYSKAVRQIMNTLDEYNILYTPEQTFDDCIDQKLLPFDIYLYEYNILIEYDGEHHFYPVTYNGISEEEAYECHIRTVKHDKMKNEYCIKNNIPLLRINYKQEKEIRDILISFLIEKGIICI